jgi:hypothetical protein
MTSLRRITLFTALACILLFGAAHTLVHAQADGSLGANGSQTVNTGTGGSQTVNPGTGGSQTVNTGTGAASLQNPLNATDLPTLLNEVLGYVVGLGTIALTIMLVYVGFLFVAARGNSEKVSQARQMLLYVVIGGLLILGAQGLETVIQSTIQAL